MNIKYDFNNNEDIVKFLVNKFPEFEKIEGTISNDFPVSIIFSDKKVVYGKLDDYPIDGLLGSYDHNTKIITIYLLGMQHAVEAESEKMGYSKTDFYQNLLKIVILHELGHYWFNNFIDDANFKYDSNFTTDICNFDESEHNNKYIHEWIAQMFAYLCLETDIEKSFMEKFAGKQPSEYKSFLKDLQLDIFDFKEAAGLLHLKQIFDYIQIKSFRKIVATFIKGYVNPSLKTEFDYFIKINDSLKLLYKEVYNKYKKNKLNYKQYSIKHTIQNHSNWINILNDIIDEAKFENVTSKFNI